MILYRLSSRIPPGQFVQPPPGGIHILWANRRIQCRQLNTQPFSMFGFDTCFRSSVEESLDTLMAKTLDHFV